jgi:hypothetical protein
MNEDFELLFAGPGPQRVKDIVLDKYQETTQDHCVNQTQMGVVEVHKIFVGKGMEMSIYTGHDIPLWTPPLQRHPSITRHRMSLHEYRFCLRGRYPDDTVHHWPVPCILDFFFQCLAPPVGAWVQPPGVGRTLCTTSPSPTGSEKGTSIIKS